MLPVDFTDRMSNILGNEYDDFISSYNKPRFHSLRINPLKTSINELLLMNLLNPYQSIL